MKIQIPDKVNNIIDTIMSHGYEAYIVGGCVRDMVLGKEPEDWDITTSATPLQIKKIFKRTIDTGIQHGTVTVLLDNDQFEVTTYRLDGIYEDNRHPKEVSFTSSLTEDLRRRDFTINAMAYNKEEGFIDQFDGLADLEKGIIRCVGDPDERFNEDALRILRAVRFSAQLDFTIESATLEAIKDKVGFLRNISAERIRIELMKLLVSDHPERLRLLYETGITAVVLPEFDKTMTTNQINQYHIYSVGEHIIRTVMEVAGPLAENRFTRKERAILRWTMFLHDIEKSNTITFGEDKQNHFHGHQDKGATTAKRILKRLKFDNETLESVVHLVRWHDYPFVLTPTGMRKATNKIGSEYMELLFEVNRADTSAKNPDIIADKLEKLEEAKRLYHDIVRNGQCVCLKDLDINGKDLLEVGFKPGRELGDLLDWLLNKVLEEPSLNHKEILLQLALNK